MKGTNFLITVMIAVSVIMFYGAVQPVFAASPTAEDLKQWLAEPIPLLGLMYVASFANALGELRKARLEGGGMTLSKYLSYLPETVAMLLGNLLAFAFLITTDTLNFVSAVGIGYGVNDVVDQFRKGGRSADL